MLFIRRVFTHRTWSPASAAEKVEWLNFPAGLNYTLSVSSDVSTGTNTVRAVQGWIADH